MSELPLVIETPRLRLRRFQWRDAADVLAYARDPQWARHLPVPTPYTLADAEAFVQRQAALDWHTRFGWAITTDDDRVVGGIDLTRDAPWRASVGFAIATGLRGRGLVPEAAAAVIDAAFSSFSELYRVFAFTDVRNTASQVVMRKLGMVHEGVLRAHVLHRDELVDVVYAGVLRPAWLARARRPVALCKAAPPFGWD
ncbi:MAG: GNAT family N-acetyltransferase [Nannocystaceae bacterium]|nr:GNAT family N-acetyltransferase [Nannocystaceae bacterium]